MKRRITAGLLATLFVVSGCSSGEPASEASATATVTVTVAPKPEGKYPAGYPKVVPVSSVPEPVKGDFQGQEKVVAVAPGVWARMTPGASVEDVAAGPTTGFCASIKAFEQKFRGGEQMGMSCY